MLGEGSGLVSSLRRLRHPSEPSPGGAERKRRRPAQKVPNLSADQTAATASALRGKPRNPESERLPHATGRHTHTHPVQRSQVCSSAHARTHSQIRTRWLVFFATVNLFFAVLSALEPWPYFVYFYVHLRRGSGIWEAAICREAASDGTSVPGYLEVAWLRMSKHQMKR